MKKIFYLFIFNFIFNNIILFAQTSPVPVPSPDLEDTDGVPPPPMAPEIPFAIVHGQFVEYTPLLKINDSSKIYQNVDKDSVQQIHYFKDGFNNTIIINKINYSNGKNLYSFTDLIDRPDSTVRYLSFPTTISGKINNPYFHQKSYYNSAHPEETDASSSYAYQVSRSISDPSQRGVEIFSPGKGSVGLNHSIKSINITNSDEIFRVWQFDPTLNTLISTRNYEINKLHGTKITDEQHGTETIEYKDFSGRLIIKKQLYNKVPKQYYVTQYIYDDMGRLVSIISPKAYEAIGTSTTVPITIFNELCFQYYYDNKGRKYKELKPGETTATEFVYDKLDRLVMSRNPVHLEKNLWSVIFYDELGRIKGSGTLNSSQTQEYFQNLINTRDYSSTHSPSSLDYFIATKAGQNKYNFDVISGIEILNYYYYDSYTHEGIDITGLEFNASLFSSESPGGVVDAQPYLVLPFGLTTISKSKIIKDTEDSGLSDWTITVNYYDVKNRIIQTRKKNHTRSTTGLIGKEYTNIKYDFLNTPLIENSYSENIEEDATIKAFSTVRKFSYLPGTHQLYRIYHKINAAPTWQTLVQFSYDDMGRILEERLGYSVEYRKYTYNLKGALKGINEDYALTGNTSGLSMSFGQRLYYDYGFGNDRFDGRISANLWRGSGTSNAMVYVYDYDVAGRLKTADFWEYIPSPASWSRTKKDFTVSNLSYDPNGNILSMKQRGLGIIDDEIVPVDMDDLTYNYYDNSNRLKYVKDDVVVDYGNGDFQDGDTGTLDYEYDNGGNLIKDNNKKIVSVSYNVLNKPHIVTFDNGSFIKYLYTANGQKIRELVQEAGVTSSITTKRNYIADMVYLDTAFQYILTDYGRVVFDPATAKYKYEYFVKDHLGNVRSVVTQNNLFSLDYLATYEIGSAYIEGLVFETVNEIRDNNPLPSLDNQYSGKLSMDSLSVGTSLVLKVMAGDKVSIEVENFYVNYNAQQDSTIDLSTLFSKALSTLLTGPGGTPTEQGYTQLVNGFFNSNNLSIFDILTTGGMLSSRPQASLNYILYDDQMTMIENASGRIQVNGNGAWSVIGTDGDLEIPRNGYLVVFIGNMSLHPVQFDNLLIKYKKGKLLEETHYYPHGLPMKMGMEAHGIVENRYKHQGNEYKQELGLNWMDFGFRQYDPQIGRFLGVDPLADYYGQDRYSPFAAMGNQPESMIDPNGLAYEVFERAHLTAPDLPIESTNSLEQIALMSRFNNIEDIHNMYLLLDIQLTIGSIIRNGEIKSHSSLSEAQQFLGIINIQENISLSQPSMFYDLFPYRNDNDDTRYLIACSECGNFGNFSFNDPIHTSYPEVVIVGKKINSSNGEQQQNGGMLKTLYDGIGNVGKAVSVQDLIVNAGNYKFASRATGFAGKSLNYAQLFVGGYTIYKERNNTVKTLSMGEYSYDAVGTLSGMYVGAKLGRFGGVYGAFGGAVVGVGFDFGKMLYEGYNKLQHDAGVWYNNLIYGAMSSMR